MNIHTLRPRDAMAAAFSNTSSAGVWTTGTAIAISGTTPRAARSPFGRTILALGYPTAICVLGRVNCSSAP
jgi:hypothetical protein